MQVGQARTHGVEHIVQLLLAQRCPLGDHLLDLGVALRVQHREREVFELPLHVTDAEPVRERRVDVDGLLRDALLLLLRKRRDRAHVVQPVGELDQQDADVLRHRDEHLAHRRGLLRFAGRELQAFDLGDAVDDRRDLDAEGFLDALLGELGVFDRVVQQRGRDGDVVEAEIREDQRDAERVGDVGLTRAAHLLGMGPMRSFVGPLDEGGVGLAVLLQVRRQHRSERHIHLIASPRQHRSPLGADFRPGKLRQTQYSSSCSCGAGRTATLRWSLGRDRVAFPLRASSRCILAHSGP